MSVIAQPAHCPNGCGLVSCVGTQGDTVIYGTCSSCEAQVSTVPHAVIAAAQPTLGSGGPLLELPPNA
jgi:hypothetical protein